MCAVLFTGVVSGCENTKVQVENLINMNAQFKGSRSITVNTGFVFEGKEDLKAQFDEAVKEFCPSAFKREVKNADDGLKYILPLNSIRRKIISIKYPLCSTGRQAPRSERRTATLPAAGTSRRTSTAWSLSNGFRTGLLKKVQ